MRKHIISALFISCILSLAAHARDTKNDEKTDVVPQRPVIDLYVDTDTKQIYAEPGAGRVGLGSFQKVDDAPAPVPTTTPAPVVAADGPPLPASGDAGTAATPPPEQPSGEADTGLAYSSWEKKDPFKFNLNADGSQYIKFGHLNQLWLRYEQNNPGSIAADRAVDDTTDIGLRRTRFVLQGQLTDRIYFYTQYGMNNFNFLSQTNGNRRIASYFHDAFGELRLTRGHQAIVGGGLTIANGLSRFSNPSGATIMTLDLPIFAQATVDQTDLFSRKLSVYMRGQIGRLNYRIIASDPFPMSTSGQPLAPISPDHATFAVNTHTKQYQGLFIWNFWDTEPMTNTFMQGTYLGKRSVLNLEAGFITQKNATWTGTLAQPRYHDLNLWSVAAYLDAPLDKIRETAVSAYVGYFDLDYGPGYLRNNGVMNTANAVDPARASINGPGNAYPMFGTGSVWYGQLGYLMSKDLLGSNNGQLMPYVSVMSADYDRLHDRMNVFNAGINWLIKGHNSKITFDYQNRPVFNLDASGNIVQTSSRNQFLLQYQIAF